MPNAAGTEPMFSVVISSRDSAATLRRSLETFLSPARKDTEIILIDDASTDDTREVIADLPDSGTLRTIRLPVRTGLTKALNIGIREARGRFIVRQDADDRSHPERLDAQFRRFCRRGNLDILGTGHNVILASGASLAIRGRNFKDLKGRLSRGPVFCHGSLMMKRDALLRLGGYDEFFEYAQDADMILRAAHAGLALENLAECLYDWFDSPGSVTSTRFREQAGYEALALKRAGNPGIDLPREFQAILASTKAYPLSKRYRDMILFLAAGDTGMARLEFEKMRADGEPIPDPAKYAFLVRLPAWAYRFLRGLRDRWP
jgi:glycosyltransferase involved in cell wall biosynthesis